MVFRVIVHKIVDLLWRRWWGWVWTRGLLIWPTWVLESNEVLVLRLRLVGVNHCTIEPTLACAQVALDKVGRNYKPR